MSNKTTDNIMLEGRRFTAALVNAVNAPLGFFVLALLIVESFLATAILKGGLKSDNQLIVLWMGVGMFVVVVIVVALLVWNKPENLTFDKQAHLDRSKAGYGTEAQPVKDRDTLLPSEPTREE